jgi:putative glutamine amidotransferase
MGQKYVRVLTEVGAIPWLIPLLTGDEKTTRAMYEAADGVFLTGGVDVDPSSYGEEPHELLGKTDAARDWTELHLIRWAMHDRKPILGVCRGIQMLNVAAGGTLYQDVQAQYTGSMKHDYFPPTDGYQRDSLVHDATIVPDSQLERILGLQRVTVNSMHHQGIKTLASGFQPTAHAPDGLIEGIEGNGDWFLIGVQWHPEELAETRPDMRRLFSAFVEAAGAYKRKSTPLSQPE